MDIGEASELQRDLGRLEGTVAAQGERISEVDKRIASLDEKLQEHNRETAAKLDRLISFQEQQRGGRRVFSAFVAIASPALGALAAWVFDLVKHPSH